MGRVDVLVRRITTSVLFSSLAMLVACTGTGGITMKTNATLTKPLIDTRVPAVTETATFALG